MLEIKPVLVWDFMSLTNSKQILVIYHADCLDGFGAAWCAFKTFGSKARYVAARFGEPFPKHSKDCEIYILDFCYLPEVLLKVSEEAKTITIIDHHVTAIERFENVVLPENIRLNFDLNHSGCVLAWQHFFTGKDVPMILQHIEDRDLWRFELAGTKEITSALYEQFPITFKAFEKLRLSQLLSVGKIQVAQFSKMVTRLSKNAHAVELLGFKGLAVNAPSFFASELGNLLAEKSGTFGMTYHFDGKKNQWIIGLRSIGDFDVGKIAVKFGGGGHVNAAGFSFCDATKINIGFKL
jgi:oligoribonuclease NrnB/cAMP/cGMP phosphodiesterase (DHH superfamily)